MKIIVSPDYDAMSQSAARLIADLFKAKPAATVVVAVGNTPVGAYRELARLYAQGEFSTDQLRPFQLDEYLGLSASDPRSLYGWARRDFVDPLAIPSGRFVRLPGDAPDPELACKQYDAAVQQAGGFDLAILGLGPNGHLGFNEPPADPHSPTHTAQLTEASLISNTVYWGQRDLVPQHALTCGMAHLLAARHILLLVSGAHKRDILQRTINGPITPAVPSSYLQQSEHVTVLADVAAWPEGTQG